MVNQMFRYAALVQSGVEGGSSANQVLRVRVQPIRFRGAGSLANQVSMTSMCSQSGYEGPEVQQIRFQEAGTSANLVSSG